MATRSTATKRKPTRTSRRGTDESHDDAGDFQFRELIKDREVESVLGAVAVGFCLGVVLGSALPRPTRQHSWTDRVTAEGLGRRLMENLERILPNAISERLHQ
jgi:hypothetical protein